ncbi:MAG: hypothetical protein IPO92_09040 [Saprospiraceae bacterium]|nr:hypothetical protein [Saprospiraceae bacterium]
MGEFIIEKFYLYFQGILLFQILIFGVLYILTKRKEILYYTMFLFSYLLYFYINAPKTFFNVEEAIIFNSNAYTVTNFILLLLGNLYYLKFIKEIFNEDIKSSGLKNIFNFSIIMLPILFSLFIILPQQTVLSYAGFYVANVISMPMSIYVIRLNNKFNTDYTTLIKWGTFANIIGCIITVCMIARYNTGLREYAFDDYPLLFVKVGILVEIFFFQFAILSKWYIQEKELATKDLLTKLEIANVKNQISRELHDDIGTTLSKINLQSYMASTKITDPGFDAKSSFISIQNNVQEIMSKIKEIIWSPDENIKELDLRQSIYDYASNMCDSKEIILKCTGILKLNIPITYQHKYQLLLICKEAINNAVKYSGATDLYINVHEKTNKLYIQIKDNGQGFDPTNSSSGMGIKNMTFRAKSIGADFDIVSIEGQGTSINIVYR